MRLSLRSLLIWLLVLALPIQAVAAAGMQHCGAAHRLMQAASMGAVAPDVHDPVHEATPHEHDFDAGMSADDSSDQGVNTSALGDDFTCSACANCCSAVALPASLVRLPAPSIEDHAAALPAPEVVSFMPGGIERPPRTFLA